MLRNIIKRYVTLRNAIKLSVATVPIWHKMATKGFHTGVRTIGCFPCCSRAGKTQYETWGSNELYGLIAWALAVALLTARGERPLNGQDSINGRNAVHKRRQEFNSPPVLYLKL